MMDIEKASNIKAFQVSDTQKPWYKRASNESPILLDSGEKKSSERDFGENKGRNHSPVQMTPTDTEHQNQGGYPHD
ncbi:MAG: hypothetical protein MSE71_09320 [Christensenellaceae bacterium]|jgi:hypothetical protein|nr:hypothetical protein [Christensenellaceae bacterium]